MFVCLFVCLLFCVCVYGGGFSLQDSTGDVCGVRLRKPSSKEYFVVMEPCSCLLKLHKP